VIHPGAVVIPAWVDDLETFTRWSESRAYPQRCHVFFLRGEIWVDRSPEELFTHNQVRLEITTVLKELDRARGNGYLFGRGARFLNGKADISVEPDILFVSFDRLRDGLAKFGGRPRCEPTRIEGSPDCVIEVLSNVSEKNEIVLLRHAYFDAGVREYWIVDGRGSEARLSVLKRQARNFVTSRPDANGWCWSEVFRNAFRITRTTDPLGNPKFTLEHRD
jgi:Uma2 family endonuclease